MPTTNTPENYLLGAYLGEISGEATFRTLVETLPEHTRDLHLLAEVERVTAVYLHHYLFSPVSTATVDSHRAEATRQVATMGIDSWSALLEAATPIVQEALEELKAAEAHAPDELLEVYQMYTAHEQALADYLRLECEGTNGEQVLRNYIEQVTEKVL